MARDVTAGIDIGTYHVKVVIVEKPNGKDRKVPMILGRGIAESKGLRHGYIINSSDATSSIASALAQAQEAAGVRVKKAFVSIGGVGLNGFTTTGSIVISRADSQITPLDIEKVHDVCENEIPPQESQNRKVIHAVPINYRIDGRPVLGDPLKLKGMKLEAKMLFVTCLEHHLNDLVDAVEEAGIEVVDVMAAPLAAGMVTLSKQQRTAGCVLANIGAETVSIVVYENGIPLSLEVFPIGSTDITNDIALGLKVPLEEAENIKQGRGTSQSYSQRKLSEIIKARLSDMFELIEAHLKKIGRNGLLPAGVVITGGGSGIGSVEDLAQNMLDLPSRLGAVQLGSKKSNPVKDATWSVAYGLCIFGMTSDTDRPLALSGFFKTTWRKIVFWIKQLLP